MEVRLWKPGDEDAILALFEQSFGRKMSLEFWRWRFLGHPSGGPYIALAWDGDRLAAHYAVSPAPLLVDGQDVLAVLSMTTMTHPDYRGRGLFEKVGGALYEELTQHGIAAVWGFPNANSHQSFLRKLSWVDIGDIPTMTCVLDGSREWGESDFGIQEIERTDGRFTELYGRLSGQRPICASRDPAVLAWRLDRNPLHTYFKFVLGDENSLSGYVIAKRHLDQDADLVDIQACDVSTAEILIKGVLSRLGKRGIRRVNAWALNRDTIRQALERSGFIAGAPVTYFGGREISPISKEFGDLRNWRLSMMDSDLY
ncbi:GNAT family N-acetyltransferase [Stappia sp. GBMRC 2046]|uniref:GNAT family N-acetyltransferase n=1 Tax=Stappia sediminis TaxID=2692190 RepID=A0A7X3LUX3_9HYPH|nr:GNAT family N-acetyltransferase [Stappia sediminis]MXN65572.1 GNAT family N-acetyltransferase [Stappia sediminis]